MVGRRQLPSRSATAFSAASCSTSLAMVFLVQIRLVLVSVMVLSPLSMKRGMGVLLGFGLQKNQKLLTGTNRPHAGVVAAVVAVDSAVAEIDHPAGGVIPGAGCAGPVGAAFGIRVFAGVDGRIVAGQVQQAFQFLPGGQAPAFAEFGNGFFGFAQGDGFTIQKGLAPLQLLLCLLCLWLRNWVDDDGQVVVVQADGKRLVWCLDVQLVHCISPMVVWVFNSKSGFMA